MNKPDSIESGVWRTIKGEEPLPAGVSSEVTITVLFDGTIACHTRSAESRAVEGLVTDIERARDRLTLQLEERFTRCPLFAAREIVTQHETPHKPDLKPEVLPVTR